MPHLRDRAAARAAAATPRFLVAAIAAGAAALAAAPAALGHAQLLDTSPASGSTVAAQPATVIFEFDEHVGGTAGAVRVYNSEGAEVDNLEVTHPDGHPHWIGVGLKPHLPPGTYTATYRVVSADTHIVYGGLVFNVVRPSSSSKVTVAGLISRGQSGEITKIAFGVVRALDYLTLALMAGGLTFLLLVRPAAPDGGGEQERAARAALMRRAARLMLGAALAGLLVSVLGVLLQGATAAGTSLGTP